MPWSMHLRKKARKTDLSDHNEPRRLGILTTHCVPRRYHQPQGESSHYTVSFVLVTKYVNLDVRITTKNKMAQNRYISSAFLKGLLRKHPFFCDLTWTYFVFGFFRIRFFWGGFGSKTPLLRASDPFKKKQCRISWRIRSSTPEPWISREKKC